MPQAGTFDKPTYFRLDGQQGRTPRDGWRVQSLQNLTLSAEGLRLAPLLRPPAPLKDATGSLGGLELPTGLALAPDGTLYVADGAQHCILKIVQRAGWQPWATFWRAARGPNAGDRFVFVPTVHRLERWPAALRRDPRSMDEVEVLCETAWDATRAYQLVLAFLGSRDPTGLDRQWDAPYPATLPAGTLCQPLVAYLPCLGGLGSAPRQFNTPRGLAVSSQGQLYVADSQNHRVQVFALSNLALVAIWGKRSGGPGSAPGEFNDPWDVALDPSGDVYIADRGNGRVQKYRCRTRQFEPFDGTPLLAHHFKVLYGPQAGERFVWIPARQRIERWPRSLGRPPQTISEAEILREDAATLEAARRRVLEAIEAVGTPNILVEWQATYPAALAAYPAPETPFGQPVHLALDAQGRLYVVDQDHDEVKVLDGEGHVLGHVTTVSDVPGRFAPRAVTVDAEGRVLLAGASGVQAFIWEGTHCVRLPDPAKTQGCTALASDAEGRLFLLGSEAGALAEVPAPGLKAQGVYLSQPLDSGIYRCPWHKLALDLGEGLPTGTRLTVWTYTAEESLPPEDIAALDPDEWQTGQVNASECLVLSPPGRYLWLKLEFKGTGTETPLLRGLQVHFPRQTYLQYLPAVYQADPVAKDFTERFLSLFERELGGLEKTLAGIAQYFDADGVPADFLPWLASWIDLSFDPNWPLEVRRTLLRRAPELYHQHGTPAGLKTLLRLAFGVEVQIFEHFRLRRLWTLAGNVALGERSRLGGVCIAPRLQLGEHARLGEFALIGSGSPLRDPFQGEAHRFSVLIPATALRDPAVERRIRFLIDTEKPAHTAYTLVRLEPRLRVGIQATVGIDTLVGAYPRLVLNTCATLGYDSVLPQRPVRQADYPGPLQVGQACLGVRAVVG